MNTDKDCRECYARGGRLKDCEPCALVPLQTEKDNYSGDEFNWELAATIALVGVIVFCGSIAALLTCASW